MHLYSLIDLFEVALYIKLYELDMRKNTNYEVNLKFAFVGAPPHM